jgi:hypothetical protein
MHSSGEKSGGFSREGAAGGRGAGARRQRFCDGARSRDSSEPAIWMAASALSATAACTAIYGGTVCGDPGSAVQPGRGMIEVEFASGSRMRIAARRQQPAMPVIEFISLAAADDLQHRHVPSALDQRHAIPQMRRPDETPVEGPWRKEPRPIAKDASIRRGIRPTSGAQPPSRQPRSFSFRLCDAPPGSFSSPAGTQRRFSQPALSRESRH